MKEFKEAELGAQRGAEFAKELKTLLEKYDVSIDAESDYESSVVFFSFYSAGKRVDDEVVDFGFDIGVDAEVDSLTSDFKVK